MFKALFRAFRLPKHELKEIEWEELIAIALRKIGWPTKTEARIYDGTRIDLLTENHACEIDWAPKWAEAIGQSLYYSIRAQRKAVVILLLTKTSDEAYVERCRTVNTTTSTLNMEDGYKLPLR